MTGKERFTEHIFQMERCSFLLDVIRSRVVATLETEAHSGSLLDCATILRVSPAYCDFVLKMKEKYPEHDTEMLCQEIYDRIWMHDHKNTARFQQFDDDLLKEWYKIRAREKQLRAGLLDKDNTVENFKNAYRINYGTEIEVIEKTGEESEIEPDIELLDEFETKLVREKLLCQMYKNGAIDERTAMDYMGEPHMGLGAFLKIVEMHTNTPDGGDD